MGNFFSISNIKTSEHVHVKEIINLLVRRTPVNLIGIVQEINIIIRGLSDYPDTIFY